MNTNMKQSIMDAARQLFSEKGFHNTSMRDIASVLNISVGNLTYHYKKKEDLIEAIALQDHQKYQKPEPLYTLKDLSNLLQRIAEQKSSRPYYYQHYVQLSQICPSIYEIQVSVLRDLSDIITISFHNFVENGLLKREFSQEYDGIIRAIMALMVYGIPDFYKTEKAEQSLLTLNCIWNIIIPCLAEQGQKEYKSLTEHK